jgi:hypothetical protein
MLTVTLRMVREILLKLVPTRRSVLLMGPPGIGKSSIPKQVADMLSMGFKVSEASSLDPTDSRGIPYVAGNESLYGRPTLLPKKEDGEKGILVIDELASCLPAVQVSLYPLFLERRLGDYKLPEGWIPMGTGNYTTDNAVAFNLSTALTDRLFILNVVPDFEVWKQDYALPRDIDPIIISFLNFRPDLFYTFDKRERNGKGKTFASPRSYEMASVALQTGLEGEALHATLAGCLSEGVATELIAFKQVHQELPNIERIYRGKDNTVPAKPDVLYALSGALVGFLKRLPKGLKIGVAMERLLEYSMKLEPEFAILTIKDAYPLYKENIVRSKGFNAWTKKFRDVVL